MRARALLVSIMATAGALSAGAQGTPPPKGKCQFQFDNTENTTFNTIKLPSGQYNSFLGHGVVARCPAQKIVLRSDSLEAYGDEGRFFFVGNVHYTEPRLKLDSDFLTYFQKEERLLAFTNVFATLPSGSTLKGPSLEFFRSIPKVRPRQKGIAVGRPTIAVIEKDAQGKAQPPVTITGNNVWLDGDSIVSSQGEVVVVRPELTATGDSLYLDGNQGLVRIMRTPRIKGTKGRPFTLVGETIDLLSKRRKLERVLAKNTAEAVSEDLNLKSDTIDLRVTDDLLQRAIAWGPARARATSPSQSIIGDSIDVLLPGQKIREMHALRKAVAEGVPDSSKFIPTEKDRLTGDTIVATFDTTPPKDTSSKPRIRKLVATGHATSLQQLPPRDTSLRVPDLNYITGNRITVTFDSAQVRNVLVEGKTSGAYLEATPPDKKKVAVPASGAAPSIATPPAGSSTTPPTKPPATPPAGVAPAPATSVPTKRP